eukprot:1149604-Pelagomonas_calceolata.AAC.1
MHTNLPQPDVPLKTKTLNSGALGPHAKLVPAFQELALLGTRLAVAVEKGYAIGKEERIPCTALKLR